jgi:PAS domain S-box-containing protein
MEAHTHVLSNRWLDDLGSGAVPRWQSILLAVTITLATLMLRIALGPVLGGDPALEIFVVPIVVSAFVGGLRAGLVATAISFVGASYFLLLPAGSLAVASSAERWQLMLVAIAGIVASTLSEASHRGRRAARAFMTELRQAESALRASQDDQVALVRRLKSERARLLAAQAVAKVGSWETDPHQMTTEWSPETHRIFETDAATFMPTHETFLRHVHPEDRAAVDAAFLASAGQVRTVEERWRWVVGEDGRAKAIGTCQDISDRKDAEASRARSAAILDSVGQAVIATDAAGIITYANRVASELYGWRTEEVLGKDIMEVTVATQSREDAIQIMEQLKRGEKWSGEFDVRRSDGTCFPALITNAAQRDALGRIIGIIGVSEDITTRRNAEASLRKAAQQTARRERLLSTMLSSISDFAYAYDRDARFLFVNQPLLDLWGLRLEDAVGKNFAELGYPPDLAMQLEREVAQVFDTRAVVAGETPYRSPAGVDGTYEYIFSPAMGDDGVVEFVVGTTRDITERKRVEALLSRSHKHLRDLIDGLGPSIFVALLTPDGVLVEVNQAPLTAAGLVLNDVLGVPFADTPWWRHSAEARVKVREAIARAANGESSRCDIHTIGSQGRVIDVDFAMVPMRDATGKVTFLIPSATVITERKQAEETLQRTVGELRSLSAELSTANAELVDSQKKFRQLADNVSDVFYINSPDLATLRYVSPAYERIWGRTAASLYANPRDWTDAILPADRAALAAASRRLGPDNPLTTSEFRITRPDGEVRWIQADAAEVRSESGELLSIVGTARDITERKEHAAQLDQTHRQLLEASRKAGMAEVATNVLHNVGNVLNSVNVSASLAVESVKNSRAARMAQVVALMREHKSDLGEYITKDPAGRHIPAFLEDVSAEWSSQQKALVGELDTLRENVDHIKQIVAMQQGYARIAGTTEIASVNELMEDALRVQRGSMEEHGVRIVREFAEMPTITVSRHKVLPILVNLMRNAKHACYGMPDGDRCVTLRTECIGDRVRLSVIDDGSGIAPENMTRIFSHGFTTRKDGHGFGLHSGALSAAELGGSLTVHSEGTGRGATFVLELPMQPAEAAA